MTFSRRILNVRLPLKTYALVVALGIGGLPAWAAETSLAQTAERTPVNLRTIVFVCEHGSVKSIVAAAHFNRIARERGLPFIAVSRGINVDDKIPGSIRDGLARDGLAPTDETPRDLRVEEATDAAHVIAFDQVPAARGGQAAVTYWKDVPPVTKDYDAARAVIVKHIETIAGDLAK